MITSLQISFPVEALKNKDMLYRCAAKTMGVPLKEISYVELRRLSLDARGRLPHYAATVEVYTRPDVFEPEDFDFSMPAIVSGSPRVVIAGMGPAGIFAALTLASAGVKPVLLERGKPVRERKRDVARIGREGVLDPDSNYSFGEGGAGCFSDGKLYTRSNKRGDVGRVLRTFVRYGAKEEILYQAHPHLGSDRMPAMIERMRESLLDAGAEIHFGVCITGIQADRQGRFCAVQDTQGREYGGDALVLATGNSASDLYRSMNRNGFLIEEKPFAMGVRVEHPQEVIDFMQYKGAEKRMSLPPAEYAFAFQCRTGGVFSFCMCPGGVVVPASTSVQGLVVNGMSDSERNSPRANAGWVTGVSRDILRQAGYRLPDTPLALLDFQQALEKRFLTPDKGFMAPAQRLTDFMNGNPSVNLPKSSYPPGIFPAAMDDYLPGFIAQALREGFRQTIAKKPAFLTREAILLGLESRTSTPVRIPRDPQTWEHVRMPGLYPCGEGAGYAGGITSSAIDGINCAEKILAKWNKKSTFGLPQVGKNPLKA